MQFIPTPVYKLIVRKYVGFLLCDFIVIPPPIENTIDCTHTVDPEGYGYCQGTNNNDKMSRGGAIAANGGDDYVLGGDGSNSPINGGEGNDLIYGELGNDSILGGNGTDRIYGGTGNDDILVGKIITSNESESPPYKDFVDCGEGYDAVYVDYLDEYQNCEVVYHEEIVTRDTNPDISNMTRFP